MKIMTNIHSDFLVIRTLSETDGSFSKMYASLDGLCIMCMFGLQGFRRDDEIFQALDAGSRIRSQMADLIEPGKISIGISSGADGELFRKHFGHSLSLSLSLSLACSHSFSRALSLHLAFSRLLLACSHSISLLLSLALSLTLSRFLSRACSPSPFLPLYVVLLSLL
jgi:hypothetical protein